MTIDVNDPRPPYKQVADDLRRRIRAGDEYAPGNRLPSIRALAKEFGISPQTVQNALRQLREDGLVVSQQGRAFFVRDPNRPADSTPDLAAIVRRLEAAEVELQELRDRVASLEARD